MKQFDTIRVPVTNSEVITRLYPAVRHKAREPSEVITRLYPAVRHKAREPSDESLDTPSKRPSQPIRARHTDSGNQNTRIKHTIRARFQSFPGQLAVLCCITVLYVLGCMFIFQDHMVLAYAIMPVAAAGVLFGFRMGVLMALLVAPFHLAPRIVLGTFEWGDLFDPAGGIYYVLLVLIGGAVGMVRDANRRMNEKICEARKTESSLRIQQMCLRALVSHASVDSEREQGRVATEILNRLDKALTFTKSTLSVLMAHTREDDPLLQRTRSVLEQSFQETRNIVFTLSPPMLYSLGLEAAVRWLTLQMQQQYGIRVKYEHETDRRISDENVRILLYQAIRELMHNACIHAEASEISVLLRKEGDGLCVVVEDNGKGFDPAILDALPYTDEGFGLYGIKERLSYFGGTVDIVSQPENGTQVTIRTPMRMKRAPAR